MNENITQAGAESYTPIDMVLHCPACGMQHIDEKEFDGDRVDPYPSSTGEDDPALSWDNPPHRSHLCHGCGHIWRPADVPTNGVAAVKTTGKADSPLATAALRARGAVPSDVPEGFTVLYVRGFDDLMTALSHAERKGGLPHNVQVRWDEFDYRRPTAAPQPQAVVPDLAVPTGSDTAADIMSKLTNEQRLHVFDKFCLYCGTSDLPCYCHRDE